MDFRGRYKYQLARISEEDEDAEEEAANEGTSMMDERDDDAFNDAEDQDSGNMSVTPSDPVVNGAADDSPTHPHSDGETNPEGTPVDNPESDPPAYASNEDVNRQANGRGNDQSGPVSSPPPSYQDPPSYKEAVRHSAVGTDDGTQRWDKDGDLERDQDRSVKPNITVNPFIEPGDESLQEDIEMREIQIAGPKDGPSETTAATETSYTTPGPEPLARFVEPMEIESQTANESSRFNLTFKGANSRSLLIMLFSVLTAIAAVLIVVLVPLAFSYVEYYELGLKRQRSTGRVLFDDGVYESGRYPIGPDYTFKKYPSWATLVQMDDISVTTTAGLSHSISCSFQYFIREGELGLLEQRFDQGYPDVIEFVAQSALKNIAATVDLSMYLEQRRRVEIMFHEGLRVKLGGNCCPDREQCIREDTCHLCSNSTTHCTQGYHVDVPFFQLLRINLPGVIVDNNLEVQLMNERAEMETFIQREMLTRKETELLTQDILNSASEITNNGTAYASLIRSLGEAEARAVVEAANSKGLALMFERMGVATDDHKASLHWLGMLEKQEKLIMGISFEEYFQLVQDYIVT